MTQQQKKGNWKKSGEREAGQSGSPRKAAKRSAAIEMLTENEETGTANVVIGTVPEVTETVIEVIEIATEVTEIVTEVTEIATEVTEIVIEVTETGVVLSTGTGTTLRIETQTTGMSVTSRFVNELIIISARKNVSCLRCFNISSSNFFFKGELSYKLF